MVLIHDLSVEATIKASECEYEMRWVCVGKFRLYASLYYLAYSDHQIGGLETVLKLTKTIYQRMNIL